MPRIWVKPFKSPHKLASQCIALRFTREVPEGGESIAEKISKNELTRVKSKKTGLATYGTSVLVYAHPPTGTTTDRWRQRHRRLMAVQ